MNPTTDNPTNGVRPQIPPAWMRDLKARGFRIGILTNMCTTFAKLFRKHFPDFIALADALVISGEEHLYKPQRAIYDLLVDRIGLPPETLCFIDDVEANCWGARDAGWQAVRYESTPQAVAALDRLIAVSGIRV